MSDATTDTGGGVAPEPKPTVAVTIDGVEVAAEPGELVIATAERHGIYIPRFCYHPRMSSVGMCRMCLVDVDTGRGPALTVSCMAPVTAGMVVSTDNDRVKKAQEGVLEFLLANHPLDCPVCDKGGECPLQDQAMSHGPGESRFVEEKRHYEKPIAISPLVYLDRERCVLCDRCTRFAREVAGDPLISFTHRGNNTQVLTFPEHPFSSYFAGNTVQICPVGALTATPYRFRARPWDLEQTESTCTTCSVGCRITVQSSRNVLLRYQGVDADPVNWGWLCDKGRYSFESVNSDQRLRGPLVRSGDGLVEAGWSAALSQAADAVTAALAEGGPGAVAVLGGARGTNEDAYAWAKLAKAVIGTDHVDAQLDDGLPVDAVYGFGGATIDEVCAASTIVLLAPDLKEELPVLYLRVRAAVEHRGSRLLELSPRATGLTPYAWQSLRYRPGEAGLLVRALTGVGDPNTVGLAADTVQAVREQLSGAGPVAVVLGRPSVAEHAGYVVDAALALRDAVPSASFLTVLRRGNVRGALDMGLSPGLLPGRTRLDDAPAALRTRWGQVPAAVGLDARGILSEAAAGRIGCLVLLGSDPIADFPDRDLARRALAGARRVVAVDTFLTESSRQADVVLAAAGFSEKVGTTTNLEGRVSALTQKVTPVGTARADWIIAGDLAARLGADLGLESPEQIAGEIRRVAPTHAGVTAEALRSQPDGVLAGGATSGFTPAMSGLPVPAADAYSVRLATGRRLYDAGVVVSQSPSLAPLATGTRLHLHPSDLDRLGVGGGGAPIRVTSGRTSAILDAVPDPSLPRGCAWMATNQPGSVVADLIDGAQPVTELRLETLPADLLGGSLMVPVLAADPMLGDVDLTVVLIVAAKVLIAFVFLMVSVMLMVWFERKLIAGMQNRIGPNKAGPWGILQTLADGIKLFFKEDLLPERADRFVFKLAPYLSLVPAFLVFAIIPIGGDFQDGNDGTVTIFGKQTLLQLADPPMGVLFVLALSSIAVYGVMLAGWSSGSKYPLLGSVRASAQMISYEAALGLAVATCVLVTGTLTTSGMVIAQNDLVSWNLVATGFVPFVVFLIAATAELNRPPFDLVEAEQELVGGFHTEYSSIRFALFFLAEFMNTVTMSAIIVTLFLGGPQPIVVGDVVLEIPFIPGWLSGMVWFFAKLMVFLFMYVWLRATLPRFRYDQLMNLGWKVLIPLALAWFLLITALRVADDQGWNQMLTAGIALAVGLAGYLLLYAALRVAARNRALEGTRD